MATIQQTIEQLEVKLKQAKAKARQIEAARRAEESKAARKMENRRKILAGAMILQKMEPDALMQKMDKFLTKPDERALFNLPPLPAPAPKHE